MFPQYFSYLFVPLLLLIGLTSSARAECWDANPIISRLLCEDGTLGGLESEIQAKYQAALSSSSASDRPFLESEQSAWLDRRRRICSKTTEPGSTDEDRRRCLQGFGTNQLDRLRTWPDFGKVTMLTDAPSDRRACALALDRSNLAWYKDIEWGTDRYEPRVPVGATEPVWTPLNGSRHVKHARFDFLNEGIARDVYSIDSDPEWRSQFHWYVIVADGEEDAMRERVTALASDLLDRLTDFGSELQQANASGFPDFYETSEPKKAASLRSIFMTPRGNGRILLMNGTTYMIVANYEDKAALFRAGKTGSLTELCQQDAVPSRAEANVAIVNADYSCPAEWLAQPIAWEGDQWDMHAAINLKEWGGQRVVRRRLESSGTRYANTLIYVGAVDDVSTPDQNAWQPLNAATEEHDSAELMLTPAGPYILIDDWIPLRPDYMPLGKTYYRIVDNGLTEVCRSTSETIPPPGYAVKN